MAAASTLAIVVVPWAGVASAQDEEPTPTTTTTTTTIAASGDPAANGGDDHRNLGELLVDIAWPVAIVLIAVLMFRLARKSPAIRYGIWHRLFGVRSVSAFGLGVEFFDKDKAAEVSRDLSEAVNVFKKRASDRYGVVSRQLLIRESLDAAARQCLVKLEEDEFISKAGTWRATVHAQHAFLREHYMQACDYVGPGSSKRKLGRAFPYRWGVVGLTFRLQEAQGEHATPAKWEELVERWGLTKQEAENRADDKSYSFITAPLKSGETLVGVFFLEFSNEPGSTAFSKDDEDKAANAVSDYFETQPAGQKLAEKVEQLHERVGGSEPWLEPLDDL